MQWNINLEVPYLRFGDNNGSKFYVDMSFLIDIKHRVKLNMIVTSYTKSLSMVGELGSFYMQKTGYH